MVRRKGQASPANMCPGQRGIEGPRRPWYCIKPPLTSIETLGSSSRLTTPSFILTSHKPPVSLITVTGCGRWDDQGFAFHSIFTSGTLCFSQGQIHDIDRKRSSLSQAGDQFPLSRYPASTTWQGCQSMLKGLIQVSSGLRSAVFLLFPVKFSISLAYSRLREPHLFIPYYG